MAGESANARQGSTRHDRHDTLQQGGEGSRDAEKKMHSKVVLQKLTADERRRASNEQQRGGWRVIQQRRGRDKERDKKGHAMREGSDAQDNPNRGRGEWTPLM